jgi:restriction endonuclease S subunit
LSHPLEYITNLFTGIYAQPGILADTLYLQGNHFSETGSFDPAVKPQLKMANKYVRHLLQNDDILFAAKGLNNFAVVYHNSIGQAVASSSFIVLRLSREFKTKVLPEYLAWYINNSKQIPILHKAKATTTIPSISIAQLSQLEINVPDIPTQQLVMEFQQLRGKEKETIKRLEFLKDQLTQEILLKAIKK